MELVGSIILALMGAIMLGMFADFLSCAYQDFADYCESVVEDKEE